MISRGKSRYASEFFVASTDLQLVPGGGVVLKHGLVVIGQHLLQGAGHWVAPQQVVVQRTVCVKPEKKKSNYQGLQNGISIGVLMNELTSYWGPGSIACQSNHKQDDPEAKIMKYQEIKNYSRRTNLHVRPEPFLNPTSTFILGHLQLSKQVQLGYTGPNLVQHDVHCSVKSMGNVVESSLFQNVKLLTFPTSSFIAPQKWPIKVSWCCSVLP